MRGHWESQRGIMKDGYDENILYKYETLKNKLKIFKKVKLGGKKIRMQTEFCNVSLKNPKASGQTPKSLVVVWS